MRVEDRTASGDGWRVSIRVRCAMSSAQKGWRTVRKITTVGGTFVFSLFRASADATDPQAPMVRHAVLIGTGPVRVERPERGVRPIKSRRVSLSDAERTALCIAAKVPDLAPRLATDIPANLAPATPKDAAMYRTLTDYVATLSEVTFGEGASGPAAL